MNPSAMCWATTTAAGRLAGKRSEHRSSADGPPVDEPIATMLRFRRVADAGEVLGGPLSATLDMRDDADVREELDLADEVLADRLEVLPSGSARAS